MSKEIVNKEKFRKLVVRAVNMLAEPVVATLGPEGLPILIDREGAEPLSTKDGVTVAKHVEVKDAKLNTVIRALKQASEKTNEEAGDGTTTAIALVRSLIREGVKFIDAEAITPQRLVADIKSIEMDIYGELKKLVQPIKTKEEQLSVAHISANNDYEIAKCIVEAIETAGENGYISVEEGTARETVVKFVEGYTMPTGWNRIGPYGLSFVNNSQKNTVEILKPAILMYDGPINDVNDFANFYIALTSNGKQNVPLLVIGYSFEGEALSMAVLNKRHGFSIGLLHAPLLATPNTRRLILEDIAVLTGGKVIDHDSNGITTGALVRQENGFVIKEGVLGCCNKISIGKHNSILYGGFGDEKEIVAHTDKLKAQLNDAESDYERDFIKTRLSKMVGGVTEIEVGGITELEMKEKKYRVEDALNATRAAIEEGVVPGGGVALFGVSEVFLSKYVKQNPQRDIAVKVLKTALKEPLRQILLNAGVQPDVVINELLKTAKNNPYKGYDAKNKVIVRDMLKAGIIDPYKVTSLALRSAVSIACELLCGGGMLAIEKESSASAGVPPRPEDLRPDLYVNEANQEM